MKSKIIKEIILERNPDAKFLEKEFDKAIIGSAIQCGNKDVAIYNSDQCIKILMEELNVGELEAYEQYQFTVESVTPSENNPILFSDFSKARLPDLPDILRDMTLDDIL